MTESIECFICGDHRPNSLEEHHVVPQRHNGSDEPENLVQLCSSCHAAIEKLYDDSFYERLGVEAVDQTGSGDLDIEGEELEPHKTQDRGFSRHPAHISREDFCINITFSQFMIHPTQALFPDYYPDSDAIISQLEENTEEIINFFRNNNITLGGYNIGPDDPDVLRLTPAIRIVPTKDRYEQQEGITPTTTDQRKRDYTVDINTISSRSDDFQRLHCGYCHTVYSEYEKADLAAHLRIKHRIEDPYLDETDNRDTEDRRSTRR